MVWKLVKSGGCGEIYSVWDSELTASEIGLDHNPILYGFVKITMEVLA